MLELVSEQYGTVLWEEAQKQATVCLCPQIVRGYSHIHSTSSLISMLRCFGLSSDRQAAEPGSSI